MTAPLLLAYICAALLLELGVGIGVALNRRRAAGEVVTLARDPPPESTSAWSGRREFRVARREFVDSGHTQCSFYLEPVDGRPLPPFKPGQFLTFSLQVTDPGVGGKDGRPIITRCYSLSDPPQPTRYRVTIKRVPAPVDRPDLPPGICSNHFHDQVHEGKVLQVKAPTGRFFIDPDPNIPAVLIAGGIGVTPMMSMLLWCVDEQPARTLHLYYGLRHGGEHAFKQELQQLAGAHPHFHLHVAYSRPAGGDAQGRDFHHVGHVDIDLLKRTLPSGRHRFYVCGPAPMMESLVPALIQWGVPQSDIHYEAFGPASVGTAQAATMGATPVSAAPVEVKFSRSRRTLVWDGKDATLLDFAERHGVVVDSGCRTGSCGSCETKVASGSVRYGQTPDHDVAPGHCLLCVGTPESALVLEA